jgi:DNA-binding NarL/FixJ family response regulator
MDDTVLVRWSAHATSQRGQPPSRRQLEVLYAVVTEHGNAQAAYKLGISVGTVKGHLTELYSRGPFHNVVDAVWELRHELEAMADES